MLSRDFDRLLAGEADELSTLTKQRDKVEGEQIKLMQARINAELDHLSSRLERHQGEYADAKAVLTRCLDLLDNLAGLYVRCDDLTRRLFNQRRSRRSSSRTTKPSGPGTPSRLKCIEAQTPADPSSAEGLSLVRMATLTRLELATSAVTGRRANQLRYRARCGVVTSGEAVEL